MYGDLSAMRLRYLLDHGQSKPDTSDAPRVERLENHFPLALRDPLSPVGNRKNELPVTERHGGEYTLAFRRRLNRVAQEVGQRLHDFRTIKRPAFRCAFGT